MTCQDLDWESVEKIFWHMLLDKFKEDHFFFEKIKLQFKICKNNETNIICSISSNNFKFMIKKIMSLNVFHNNLKRWQRNKEMFSIFTWSGCFDRKPKEFLLAGVCSATSLADSSRRLTLHWWRMSSSGRAGRDTRGWKFEVSGGWG